MKNETHQCLTAESQQANQHFPNHLCACATASAKFCANKEEKHNISFIKADAPIARELVFNWVDIPGACKLLKVSPRTLQTYRDESRIGFSQIGSKIYFKLSDLEDFLTKHYLPALK